MTPLQKAIDLDPTIRIAREIQICAKAWEPEARLIGNVPAGDIFTCIESLITEAQRVEELEKENAAFREMIDKLVKESVLLNNRIADLKDEVFKLKQGEKK